MRMINGLIGLMLLALALLHFFIPNSYVTVVIFLAGAGLAFVTLIRGGVGLRVARVLAVATTAVMFFYFAGFFLMAGSFNEHWYYSGAAFEGVGMLLSAFAMIPVLSCYSCMLKAEGHRREVNAARSPAFFRVPENIRDSAS
jgi:membrane-bound ClpP family serine protease